MPRPQPQPYALKDETKRSSPWGICYYPHGRRRRLYFSTRKARDEKLKELLDAAKVFRDKAIVGAEVEDVVLAKAVRDALRGRPLMQMLELWERHESLTRCTVKEAADLYLKTKRETIEQGNTHAKIAIDAFLAWLADDDRQVGDVSRKEMLDYFDDLRAEVSEETRQAFSPTTIRNRHKVLHAWFNFCLTRELIVANPVRDIPLPEVTESEVEILSVPKVFRLFHAAFHHDPGMLGLLALSAYAGLRTTAILRLEAKDLKMGEGINFPAAKFKTKTPHFAAGLPEAFWVWSQGLLKEDVLGIKKRAFEYRRTNLAKRAGVTLPPNWGRHSFATYFSVLHGDINKAAAVLGHRSSFMTWKHYKGLATEFEAKAYFALRPRAFREAMAPEAFDIVFSILKQADAGFKGGASISPEDLIPSSRVKAADDSWLNAVEAIEAMLLPLVEFSVRDAYLNANYGPDRKTLHRLPESIQALMARENSGCSNPKAMDGGGGSKRAFYARILDKAKSSAAQKSEVWDAPKLGESDK